jgi:hypothetical protein
MSPARSARRRRSWRINVISTTSGHPGRSRSTSDWATFRGSYVVSGRLEKDPRCSARVRRQCLLRLRVLEVPWLEYSRPTGATYPDGIPMSVNDS